MQLKLSHLAGRLSRHLPKHRMIRRDGLAARFFVPWGCHYVASDLEELERGQREPELYQWLSALPKDAVLFDVGTSYGQEATLALDDYAASRGLVPKHLKIDVDSAEFGVLKGAEKILANPVLTDVSSRSTRKMPALSNIWRPVVFPCRRGTTSRRMRMCCSPAERSGHLFRA